MKGNNGSGNNPSRDGWKTPKKLFSALHSQYGFSFDCCASPENAKCEAYSTNFEEVVFVEGVGWMNPPFSKAKAMFYHFFKVVKRGVAIYRCDNFETDRWQDAILPFCDWVFIPRGRVEYEGQDAPGARFPSALIGIGVEPPKGIDGYIMTVANTAWSGLVESGRTLPAEVVVVESVEPA